MLAISQSIRSVSQSWLSYVCPSRETVKSIAIKTLATLTGVLSGLAGAGVFTAIFDDHKQIYPFLLGAPLTNGLIGLGGAVLTPDLDAPCSWGIVLGYLALLGSAQAAGNFAMYFFFGVADGYTTLLHFVFCMVGVGPIAVIAGCYQQCS